MTSGRMLMRRRKSLIRRGLELEPLLRRWLVAHKRKQSTCSVTSFGSLVSSFSHPFVYFLQRHVAEAQAVLPAVISMGLPEKVVERCAVCNSAVTGLLKSAPSPLGRELLHAVEGVQLRALACLNNMLLLVDLSTMDPAFLSGLWAMLFQLGKTATPETSPDLVHSVLGSMWCILRKAVESPDTLLPALGITEEQVLHVCAGIESPDGRVRSSVAGVAGCLGQLAVFRPHLPVFADLLLRALQDSSQWVMVEALNSIFDVFAEPDVNEVVVQKRLLETLQALRPVLQEAARSSGRGARASGDAELHGRLDEARINLARFLKYKAKQFA
eukprot:m.202252 g.202252  ORF g.202252 m.202252 type:complete len:328 (+) comp21953_c0_seq7:1937-2920(+)